MAAVSAPIRVLQFCVGERRLALELSAVERVERAVAITPLPGAPPGVAGVIDVHGAIVPVLDLRHHLGLPPRELQLCDVFILAQVRGRRVALWAESAERVTEVSPERLADAEHAAAEAGGVASQVLRLPDGLSLFEVPEHMLSPEADAALTRVLSPQ